VLCVSVLTAENKSISEFPHTLLWYIQVTAKRQVDFLRPRWQVCQKRTIVSTLILCLP